MNNEIIVKKNEGNNTVKHSIFVLFGVLIITAIVFSGSLKLEWTNWDDNLYIYENPLVSKGTLQEIFTTPGDYNTYNPLVIASFALEWTLVKDKPFLYHLDNLLLHLLCTVLALLFFRSMGLSVWWSGFAALLFGIHPLRVESVAWITERKDVLYVFFYLLALLAYVRYIAHEKRRQLLFTFVFFMLSLLSKGQAVLLPLALVLLDWYFKRKISLKVIAEKAVFFLVSLSVTLFQYLFFIKRTYASIDSKSLENVFVFSERLILCGYAYVVLFIKSFVPFVTSPLYPIPTSLGIDHWAGAAMAVALFLSALAARHKCRFATFGLLFFTFHIFFFLPFTNAGQNFINDRYTYVAYIGLFFIIAKSLQILSEKKSLCRMISIGIAVVMLAVFSIMTTKYIPVWKNSETLWTHVIEKYPRQIPVSYLNRGHYWYKNNQLDKALEDFSTAIEIHPEYLQAYMNRGLIYLESNNLENALKDYNHILDLMHPYDISSNVPNPSASDALGNRGTIYSQMGQYKKALIDFDLAIKLNPQNPNNYLNRAFVYIQLGDYEKCIQDLTLSHQSNPGNPDILNNRGVCYLRLGNLKSALDDFNKAILLNGENHSYYRNRESVYRQWGYNADANQDKQSAENMDSN